MTADSATELTDVVVIGAGQAGLAMSSQLAAQHRDHVVLERREVAYSWKHERWDSLRLLTPNWMTRLPGLDYDGPAPDEFDTAQDVATQLVRYSRLIDAPIREHTDVLAVRSLPGGFAVSTTRGTLHCRAVVVASGACVSPSTPPFADRVPARIEQINPLQYRNPSQLRPGRTIVVGASASGTQLADEIARSGREVVLCAGEHVRMLRRYRGMDIFWWMEMTGMLDDGADDFADHRLPPSMQLVGTPEHRTLDLNALQDLGVTVTGRMVGVAGERALIDNTLAQHCREADAAMSGVLAQIDDFAKQSGLDREVGSAETVQPTRVPNAVDSIDLASVDTIIWATGFAPHFPFLDPAWLDERGAIRHRNGIARQPGLYVLGLPFTRRRTSNFISGVGGDAEALVRELSCFLDDGDRANLGELAGA